MKRFVLFIFDADSYSVKSKNSAYVFLQALQRNAKP